MTNSNQTGKTRTRVRLRQRTRARSGSNVPANVHETRYGFLARLGVIPGYVIGTLVAIVAGTLVAVGLWQIPAAAAVGGLLFLTNRKVDRFAQKHIRGNK